MEKYESKQVQINRPDEMIYGLLSDFNTFTPLLAGKVDGWEVDGDTCSFTVKGITLTIRMAEKTPFSCIKISGDEGSPFEFFFWIQLVKISEYDTRMKLTLHANLNMMMKMMLGKKLQEGLNQIAEQMAMAFNMTPEQARQMAETQGWSMPEGQNNPLSDEQTWPMPDPDKPAS